LLAYLIAWVAIPDEVGNETEPVVRRINQHGWTVVAGASLVALGALLLLRNLVPWFGLGLFWPLVVVGVGVLVLTSVRR